MIMTEPFPGTEDELLRLSTAVSHNCTCEPSEDGSTSPLCPAHVMLGHPEELRHLVFSRRRWQQLLEQEFRN